MYGGGGPGTAGGSPCGQDKEENSADTIRVLEQFQQLYRERLKKCATLNSPDNSKVKLKVMEDWVVDLTEQNRLLLNEVEGLEKAAAQRLICLERSGSTEQLKLNDELTEKTRRLCQLESEMERLEKTLCDKECQLEATVRKNQSLLNNLNQKTSECAELQKLDARNRLTQMESEVACLRRTLSQKELVLEQYTCQISELRQQVERKECELEEVRSSRCSRLSEMELDLRRLQEVLYEKECQLEKCTQQISELQQCIEARIQHNAECRKVDRCLMTDDNEFSKVEEELKLRTEEVRELSLESEKLQDAVNSGELEVQDLHRTLAQLQRASRDVQSALTAEVAEKHDAVVALRREAAQLEEQLRQSEMQTHFKDDIIKQLRKEVKLARAKESLAEIFGLKECPRIQMKEKIERLNAELEDRQMVIAELEHRLEATRTQELEDRINKLNRQLMSRERDIVALCNKMDYVRRYVKRLRDDEELSVKCGLEALLHELNEDSEWNKETRRSVTSMCSDMADSSVIVINRVPARSLSLPDSSIKKHNEWNLRTWSEPSVMSSQQGVLDFVPDKCEDAAKLRELQRNLDDSSAKLSKMWKDIKLLSLDISNNTIYNDLEEFKDETKLDHETLAQINVEIQNIVNTLDPQSPQNDGVSKEYLLGCLENNLADLMELLARDGLVQTDSTLSFEVAPNCAQLTPQEVSAMIENITIHIGDSVSIIQQIKGSLPCQWMSNEGCGMNKSIEQTLKDMQIILDDVISNRKCAYKKLCNIQKIQSESYCNISQKFAAFDEMYAIHESTAKFMKHEVANIVNRLASNEYERRVKDNVGSKSRSGEDYLGEKVTIKEQEIMKKDRKLSFLNKSLFHKMDSLKPCRSSPLPCQTERPTLEEDALKNFDEKSYQAQQVVNDLRKEIESTMCKLINREEKLALLEKEVATVNRSLYNVQTEIRNIKHYLQSPQYSCLAPKISKLESNLNQAELDVKRLLAKSQSYVRDKEAMEKSRMEAQRAIATLQSDLSNLQIDMSDSLKTIKMQIAPSSSGGQHSSNDTLVEGLRCQLDAYKKKIERLEEDLMRNPVSGDCCLSQETSLPKSEGVWPSAPSVVMTSTLGETQLQLIEMQEDMKRSLQEAYSSLSSKDMELLNSLQLNEESERLKKDICNLQKDLDSRQKVIDNQQETIALLQDGLGRAKCETDTLSTKLQTLSCEKKNVEMENQRVMQELQAKVCSLQAALQKGNANTKLAGQDTKEMSELRGANLELMMIAAKFQHAYQLANRWLQYTNRQKAEAERKADTAVAALQVIVCRQRQQIEDFEQFEVELRKQKSALEGQLKKVCSENNSNKHEIKTLKDKLNDTEVELCHSKKQVEQLKSVIKTFESKLCGYEGNQSAVAHLQNKLQQAHELLDSMKLEKELALNELQQERSANTVHSNRIASLKSDYAAKREEAEHWQSRANKLKENVSSLFEEIQILRRENTELSASYKNVECQIESLNLELDKLKEENCQLSRKLMKNTQIACEMREGHHMTVEQLNKEVEKLKIENGCLKSHCQQECGSQNDQDAEWKQRYKEKCNEASVIYSELEAKNKETDEKNRLLQKRKEAIDFLSGKVAELETSIVEKDNLLKYLECNLRQFSKQCEECQVSLRNEMARTKQLEHHLSSAKERIATMTQVIDQLESEKDKLLEVLSKKVEAEKKQSCQEMTFATPGGNDKLAEQRKFSIKLAQKLRIYKEKLNTSLNHNRNLMETLNKLHSLNRVLLGAQQSGGQCPGGTWVGDPQGQLRGQQHLQSHPTPSYVDPCGTDGMFWPQIRFQVAESEESEHY